MCDHCRQVSLSLVPRPGKRLGFTVLPIQTSESLLYCTVCREILRIVVYSLCPLYDMSHLNYQGSRICCLIHCMHPKGKLCTIHVSISIDEHFHYLRYDIIFTANTPPPESLHLKDPPPRPRPRTVSASSPASSPKSGRSPNIHKRYILCTLYQSSP